MIVTNVKGIPRLKVIKKWQCHHSCERSRCQ